MATYQVKGKVPNTDTIKTVIVEDVISSQDAMDYAAVFHNIDEIEYIKQGEIVKGIFVETRKLTTMEKLAFKAYPKNLHQWAKDPPQFDDLNDANRNIWMEGYKANIELLTLIEGRAKVDTSFELMRAFFERVKVLLQEEHPEANTAAIPPLSEEVKENRSLLMGILVTKISDKIGVHDAIMLAGDIFTEINANFLIRPIK